MLPEPNTYDLISYPPSRQDGAGARGAAEEDEGVRGAPGRRQEGEAHRGARQEVRQAAHCSGDDALFLTSLIS